MSGVLLQDQSYIEKGRLLGEQGGLRMAQVSDFGLSMLFKPGQEQAVAMQHGTLAFMPPELLTNDILSYATDVYSFGMLLWEMIACKVRRLSCVHLQRAF